MSICSKDFWIVKANTKQILYNILIPQTLANTAYMSALSVQADKLLYRATITLLSGHCIQLSAVHTNKNENSQFPNVPNLILHLISRETKPIYELQVGKC